MQNSHSSCYRTSSMASEAKTNRRQKQHHNRKSRQADQASSFYDKVDSADTSRLTHGRVLQRWCPEGDNKLQGVDLPESHGDSTNLGGWDQFAENERLFGYKSTYNPDFYFGSSGRENRCLKDTPLVLPKGRNEPGVEEGLKTPVSVLAGPGSGESSQSIEEAQTTSSSDAQSIEETSLYAADPGPKERKLNPMAKEFCPRSRDIAQIESPPLFFPPPQRHTFWMPAVGYHPFSVSIGLPVICTTPDRFMAWGWCPLVPAETIGHPSNLFLHEIVA